MASSSDELSRKSSDYDAVPVSRAIHAVFHLSEDGRVIDCTGEAAQWWGLSGVDGLRDRAFVSLFFFDAPAGDEDPEVAAWKLLAAAAAVRPLNLQARVEGGGFEAVVQIVTMEDDCAAAGFSARVERTDGGSFHVLPLPELGEAPLADPATDTASEVDEPVEPERSVEQVISNARSSKVGFFELDFARFTARFSAAWARLLDFSPEELSAEPRQLAELFHPEDSEAAPGPGHTGEPLSVVPLAIEARLQTRDGDWRWMQLEGVQEFNGDGKLTRVAGVMLDAQERHETEEELLRVEERFRRLTSGGAGFFEIDFQSESAQFSREFRSVLGYTAGGLGGTLDAFMKLLPADDAEAGAEAFFRSLAVQRDGLACRYQLRHAEGHLIPIEAHLVFDESRDGQLLRVMGVQAVAGAEPAKTESAQDGSEAWTAVFGARRALDAVAEDVVVVDPHGRIRHANARALATAGKSLDDARGQLVTGIYQFVDRATEVPAVELLQRAMASGEVIELDHTYALIEESGRSDVVLTCRPLFDERKRVEGAVIVFRRPSEMPLSPSELVASNRMEALGRLACGVSHDFNNLLTTIAGGVALAVDKHEWAPLEPVRKACDTAKNLAKQLLSFSRGGEDKRRVQSLNTLIRDTAQMAGAGTNAAFEFELPDDVYPVEIDGVQFVQVFTNLILNATQVMPDGGTIGIRTLNMPLGHVNSVSLPAGDYVRVDVQDTGPGISPEQLDRIFEPFYSTRADGTGLGLPMVRSIITQHDGAIEAVSSLGSGTTFTFYLPRAYPTTMEEVKVPVAASFGSGRVLFVDDDKDLCTIVEGMLEVLGYEADTAHEATEAMKLFTRYRNQGRHYLAVILDMTMPGGPSGEEILAQMRALDPSVKAIVSSGYASEEHERKYKEAGFDSMLAKPFRSSDLGRALKELAPSAP